MRTLLQTLLLATTLSVVAVAPARADEVTLALANSTCDVMEKAIAAYPGRASTRFKLVCKSSGLLAKGMRGGVLQADIFLSADEEWMRFAIAEGLVEAKQASSPWGNALVVAMRKDSPVKKLDWSDLATDQVGTVLIGDPSTAPFGRHAKEALEASRLWDRVKHKIQTRKHIQLLAESLGSAGPDTAGIMFRTNLTDRLHVVAAVDPALHAPIRYHLAPLKASAGKPEVAAFLAYLHSKPGRAIFRAEGFDTGAP